MLLSFVFINEFIHSLTYINPLLTLAHISQQNCFIVSCLFASISSKNRGRFLSAHIWPLQRFGGRILYLLFVKLLNTLRGLLKNHFLYISGTLYKFCVYIIFRISDMAACNLIETLFRLSLSQYAVYFP